MIRTTIAIAMVVTVTGPSVSQTLPRYDPAAHCEVIADTAEGSRVIYNGCMQMEQEAYDKLKETWPSLSASTRSHCDEVARSGGEGTYAILDGCIQMEVEAAGSTPEFRF